MCVNQADYANAQAAFEDDENITVLEMTTDDAWVRDTGATWVVNDALAVRQIQAAFDAAYGEGVYKVVGVQTDQVVFGGGNIHCITQQEPADK